MIEPKKYVVLDVLLFYHLLDKLMNMKEVLSLDVVNMIRC